MTGAAGPAGGPPPAVSVVVCTYQRAARVVATVEAVLAQDAPPFEVVVVDDGSTDGTPDALAALGDPRLRVVCRPNGGPSAARNSGIAVARGTWTVFLDDDDVPDPGWLASFATDFDDDGVGIACRGATFVDHHGTPRWIHRPHRLTEQVGDVVGSFQAGTFAVRTDLVRAAGGYLPGLGASEQTELFLRLVPLTAERGLRVASADTHLLRIEARPATDRPSAHPHLKHNSTRWILTRHPGFFAGRPVARARYEGVAGTAAARLGDGRAARRHLWRAVRATPREPRAWGRLALAAVPPLGARVWSRNGDWDDHDAPGRGLRAQSRSHLPADGSTAPGEDDAAGGRELFLPWRYRENPVPDAPDVPDVPDAAGSGPPGRGSGRTLPAARRAAARLVRRWGGADWVELPGPGAPAPTEGAEHGARAAAGLAGSATSGPSLVVCADVLDRVVDPVATLHAAAARAGGGPVLVATPDRAAADPDRPLGPPSDPAARRAWNRDELELLMTSAGFVVERAWHSGRWSAALRRRIGWGPRPGGTPAVMVLARERRD